MVLKLTPLVEPVINVDYDTLEELVKGMFQSRRKIIRHGAKSVHQNEDMYGYIWLKFIIPKGVNESCVEDNQILVHVLYDSRGQVLPLSYTCMKLCIFSVVT